MATTETHRRAAVVERQGRRWWLCPNCRKTAGEIIGERFVIKLGKLTLTYPAVKGMTHTCIGCGYESRLESMVDS